MADVTATVQRRFTILDGMVLIAATAPLTASLKTGINSLIQGLRYIDPAKLFVWSYFRDLFVGDERPLIGASRPGVFLLERVVFLSMPFLCYWSLALLALRLVQPRPAPRDLFRQPGLWACGVASAVTLMIYASSMVPGALIDILAIPAAVVVTWLALAVGRLWRPEPSWIDLAGRLIGFGWLTIFPFIILVNYFHEYHL